MRELEIERLRPLPKLPVAVLHKSGVVLLRAGEELQQAALEAMRRNRIDRVFLPDAGEDLDTLRRILTHVEMRVNELQTGTRLERSIYDERGQLLLEEGTTIPGSFADAMARRNIVTIYWRKPAEDLQAQVGRQVRAEIESLQRQDAQILPVEQVKKIEEVQLEQAAEEDLDENALRAKIDRLDKIEIEITGEPFSEMVTDTRKVGPVTKEEKRTFSGAVQECLDDLSTIFTDLRKGQGRNCLPVMDRVVTRALAGLIRNRDLLMICGTTENGTDYAVHHALAMTVVAINIGTSTGYSTAQVKSLAYGAMLADVGMLKVPEEILRKDGKLSPNEFAEIKRHPAFGLDMLQRIRHIPAEVPYVVYQSHERANGSGYPCGKKDVVVHPFARTVAVADIYTSVCSHRPYREAKTPYEAMEQLVLMVGKRLLSRDAVKAFLMCNSMFPVGSFIRINDGHSGRVVAANPEDYMRPLVALLVSPDSRQLPEPRRLNMLEAREMTVTQALRQQDLPIDDGGDALIGF